MIELTWNDPTTFDLDEDSTFKYSYSLIESMLQPEIFEIKNINLKLDKKVALNYIFIGLTGETIYAGNTDAEKFTEGQYNSYQQSFYKDIGSASMYEFSVKLVALQLEGYDITEVDSDEESITCYTKPEKPTGNF